MGVGLKRLKYTGPSEAYFVVGGPTIVPNPFRHLTQDDAAQEAIRLARLNPIRIFTVFGAQLKFRFFSEVPTDDPQLIDFEKDPFIYTDRRLTDAEIIKRQEKTIGELKFALRNLRDQVRIQQLSIERLRAVTKTSEPAPELEMINATN